MANPAGSSGASSSSTGAGATVSVQTVDIRVPKDHNKKLAIMRFNNSLGVDFSKWTQPKIERENNQVQLKSFNEDTPKFGAGSEYGREAREEARRKKYGIISKKYRPEDQPWILQYGGKNGKKLRGVREGGVAENASYYILTQAADGAFEAFPVQEWYNFQTVQTYKALSYEEAEEEFTSRNRTFNLFNVMVRKRMKKDEDADEDGDEEGEGKSKGKKKKSKADKRYGDDMDEMMDSSAESSDDEDNEDGGDDKPKSKKKGKKGAPPKKRRQRASDDEEEDSDGREGRELDYISSSDAESDLEISKDDHDLKGVAEEDGLRKLLNSDEEDEEEEEKEENKEDEEEAESADEKKDDKGAKEDKAEKKKKKKKDGKKPRKEDYGSSDSGDSDGGSSSSELEKAKPSPKNKPSSANSSRSATPTKPGGSPFEPSSDGKRKGVSETASTSQASKKPRLDMPSTSSSSAASSPAASLSANEGVNEESVRRYLQRKPMTTTELLQKFKSKKTGLTSDQLVTLIAQILKKINPVKQMIKGKMYLSIKG